MLVVSYQLQREGAREFGRHSLPTICAIENLPEELCHELVEASPSPTTVGLSHNPARSLAPGALQFDYDNGTFLTIGAATEAG